MIKKMKLYIAYKIFGDINDVNSNSLKGNSVDLLICTKMFLYFILKKLFSLTYNKSKDHEKAGKKALRIMLVLTVCINTTILIFPLYILEIPMNLWIFYLFIGIFILETYLYFQIKNSIKFLSLSYQKGKTISYII